MHKIFIIEKIKVRLWNTDYAPGGNKSKKAIFRAKFIVKVTDLYVIWKDIISGVCMPNMKLYL